MVKIHRFLAVPQLSEALLTHWTKDLCPKSPSCNFYVHKRKRTRETETTVQRVTVQYCTSVISVTVLKMQYKLMIKQLLKMKELTQFQDEGQFE